MKFLSFILCSLAVLGYALSYKSYAGYQVLKTIPVNESELFKFDVIKRRPEFHFWSEPRVGHPLEVMAAPEHLETLKKVLNHLGLKPSVLIADVEAVFENERSDISRLRLEEKKHNRAPSFDRYLSLDEMLAYMNNVVAMYPNISEIIEIGTSYQGRPLRVLKISNGPDKTGFFMDSLMHGYEWMGGPVILYAINELTENLDENQAVLDANDFYFLPVANPDGYSFSWTDDRLWRKTRSVNEGSECIGTDFNRNFDQHWAEGGNFDACNEMYHGSVAFSEVESRALADFITNNPSITMYCTFHSHGQKILHPWGHTSDLPANVNDLNRVGNEARGALYAVNNTLYEVGSAANILYFKFGSSYDWCFEQAGITLPFSIYLPSGGDAGFDPPASDILPVVTEIWAAIKSFATNIPASRGL